MFKIRLKILREGKSLSQRELAQSFGVSQGTIGNWESGIREPDFDTVKKLSDYFDVTTDYLLGKSDDSSPSETQQDSNDINNISFAFINEINEVTKGLSEDQREDVYNFAKYISEKKKNRQ